MISGNAVTDYMKMEHTLAGKKVYLYDYGCNRRTTELSRVRRYLTANGYRMTTNPRQSDLLCVSTCAFKEL